MGLVRTLQIIRDGYGKAIKINSACRCEEHNRAVGGVPKSYHLLCRAVDIRCYTSRDRFILTKLALNLGLSVGLSDNFIHLDNRDEPVIFLY